MNHAESTARLAAATTALRRIIPYLEKGAEIGDDAAELLPLAVQGLLVATGQAPVPEQQHAMPAGIYPEEDPERFDGLS